MCCGELGSSEHVEVWPKYSAQSPGEGDQEVDKKHTSCSSISPMSGHLIAEQLRLQEVFVNYSSAERRATE